MGLRGPAARVHKVTFDQYRELMREKAHAGKPTTWFLMEPKERFTADQLAAMKAHAESQLGRPYLIRGWWKGHEIRGIFCSQLVDGILSKSLLVDAGGV